MNLLYFINLRQQWDQFLSKSIRSSSSDCCEKSVPLHWVEPNQNPNEEWSRFIKK